jgi:hypothetical protein
MPSSRRDALEHRVEIVDVKRDVHRAYLAWIGRYVRSLLDAAIFQWFDSRGEGLLGWPAFAR